MLPIDTPQQLALIEPERQRVIRLPRAGLPRGFLTRQDDRQAIEIGDDAPIDGLVDREQPGLMCQELADSDALLAVLRELRPVCADPFVVVEPTPRVGDCEGHRGEALGGRMDDHHRVLVPRLSGLLVSDATPEIDDFLAAVIRATGAAQFPASSEVVGECVARRLEATTDLSLYGVWCQYICTAGSGRSVSGPQEGGRQYHDPEQ